LKKRLEDKKEKQKNLANKADAVREAYDKCKSDDNLLEWWKAEVSCSFEATRKYGDYGRRQILDHKIQVVRLLERLHSIRTDNQGGSKTGTVPILTLVA